MIHNLADVRSDSIGSGTDIWQFAVVLEGALIGNNCNINCHTFVEGGVLIGNNVTIKSGCFLWKGVCVEDDVFIGPNVSFTNDLQPRSKHRTPFLSTILKKGCSIGANSSILAGTTIGEYAMIGMASTITKDIPAYALVYGSPAKIHGWVDEFGEKLVSVREDLFMNSRKDYFSLTSTNKLEKVIK